MRKLLALVLCALCSGSVVFAQEDGADSETFKWQTSAGRYTDPSSFFPLHGYVDAVFAGPSADWNEPDPTQIGPPGQLLIPRTDESSYSFDAALFFGAELSQRTRLMIETHLVNDPSGAGAAGPAGFTFVLTEATVSWDLIDDYLTLSAGIFWSPFGKVNDDWLGAENLFTTIPRAAAAYPLHFNEKGMRFTGAHAFSETSGFNYVVAVGNGSRNFNLSGLRSFDENSNKNVSGRIGIFPGLGNDLDIGLSAAYGVLREDSTGVLDVNNPVPEVFEGEYSAFSLDATYKKSGVKLRGYWVTSTESLDPAHNVRSLDNLTRNGAMLEGSYRGELKKPFLGLGALIPKLRFDHLDKDAITLDNQLRGGTDPYSANVYSIGLSVIPVDNVTFDNFYLSLEYHIQEEIDGPDLDNNRLVFRLTGKF